MDSVCCVVTQILIADRSPFSAVFYAKHGHLLEQVIRHQIEEVKKDADIEIFTVHVKVQCGCVWIGVWSMARHPCLTPCDPVRQVSKETLWSRILERLRREPSRAKYHEVRMNGPLPLPIFEFHSVTVVLT